MPGAVRRDYFAELKLAGTDRTAKNPPIRILNLQGCVDRGKHQLRRSLDSIDYPQITGRDDDGVTLVGMNVGKFEPSEAGSEIADPSAAYRLKLDDHSFPTEAAPFCRASADCAGRCRA